ncbi:hypothetical protein [Methanolobus sp. WCC5]|uniref:hypothetical protein n=1 Tax=Methanolobus sp. WCC5 TaxID=3125785 RepID=UPI003253D223
MTFVPISRRCKKCKKPVHIITSDQLEVECECGVKYRVVKQADYSLEEISSREEKEEGSPWEKFTKQR